ncbi:peptidase U62 modulator of DNA gyrase [Methanocaldococcus villosus KIN24-T80]|uniref:Peptidase U62 modulator of DNA gyrase n=1 Tax=Methanocaldococcus villosus KIN24-T80 TaxID=1069083 RepID=N6V0S9_9EURY|nr:TldD/PmbA family protein [Methanocaldococcus villosus]ENN95918.1 peptidase U62 modulator of DNA gyrase [Methanocaldococcus villosus KIN24-T80]
MDIVKLGEKYGYDVEIFMQKGVSVGVELDGENVDSFEYHSSIGYGIRVLKNNKVGFAYGNVLNEELLKKAMKNLVYDEYSSLAEPDKYKEPKGLFNKEVCNLTEEELLDRLLEMKEINANILSGGVYKSISYFRLINSYGLDVEERQTFFSANISIMLNGETAYEYKTDHKLFNTREVSERAVELAKNSANGKKIRYKGIIILSPRALSNLLYYTLYPAFSAENVQRNRSYLKDKLGEEVFSKNITIVDDNSLDYALYSEKCDAEGVKSQRTVLVENGVLKSYLYDIKRANVESKESTSNCSRGYSTLPSIAPTNFIIEEKEKNDFDEYVYINDIIGAHTSNPITGDFSIEIKNSYLYKKGEIIGLKKGLFSGNIFKLFKNAIPLNDSEQRGHLISPSIAFEGEIIN